MKHLYLQSPHGESPIIVEAEFSASCARLFQAWTNPEDVKKWFGAEEGGPESASIDLRVGGLWEFVFAEHDGQKDSLAGRYTEIEQDKQLNFTWVHTRTFADGKTEQSPESQINIIFESRGKGSFARLEHHAIQAEGSRLNIGSGWDASFAKIKTLIE